MGVKDIPTKTLSVNSIKDFQVCERFYSYRYEEKEPEIVYSRELIAQRLENTLKRVATFFFYKKQNNIAPSYTALLNRWEKLWFPKDMTDYDIATQQLDVGHGSITSYSNTAVAGLERFHKVFAEDPDIPILIDEPFLLPMHSSQDLLIRLEGKIDLVLRDSRNNFKVIKWIGRNRKPGINSTLLDFAAIKAAFEHRQDSNRVVTYGFYDLAAVRGEFTPVDVKKADIDALYYWAHQIGSKETFVPRRGYTAYCKGCSFDSKCEKWNEWPKK